MKNTVSISAFILAAALALSAQTTAPLGTASAGAAAPSVTFPSLVLPAGIAAFGEFNQLGSPRWTAGFSAIYPLVGSAGVYGTTTADVLPKLATDPATGKRFYAIAASARQGFHKSLVTTGNFTVLAGGDVGPSFSQSTESVLTGKSAITVSFSTSVIVTGIYRINQAFSAIVPVRMLYVSGIGWNPVLEAGIVMNLKNLPKAKQ
jgi:hypothetical protein